MNGEFCNIVGITDRNRVIENFLEGRELDFAPTYLSKELGISKTSMYNIINSLLSQKILTRSRMVGNTQLYKLNREDAKVKHLIIFFDQILNEIEILN